MIKAMLDGLVLPFGVLAILVFVPSPWNWILAALLVLGFVSEYGGKTLLLGLLGALGLSFLLLGAADDDD